MKYEMPKIDIKSFEKSIIVTDSSTNTDAAETSLSIKATGGVKKVSYDDLNFVW